MKHTWLGVAACVKVSVMAWNAPEVAQKLSIKLLESASAQGVYHSMVIVLGCTPVLSYRPRVVLVGAGHAGLMHWQLIQWGMPESSNV